MFLLFTYRYSNTIEYMIYGIFLLCFYSCELILDKGATNPKPSSGTD